MDAKKTIVAGNVRIACFDKTGTLTTTKIDVLGYMPKDF